MITHCHLYHCHYSDLRPAEVRPASETSLRPGQIKHLTNNLAYTYKFQLKTTLDYVGLLFSNSNFLTYKSPWGRKSICNKSTFFCKFSFSTVIALTSFYRELFPTFFWNQVLLHNVCFKKTGYTFDMILVSNV